jgi:Flp pilus assembly protein TadD
MELTISEGLISGLRDLDREKIVQTTAAISRGSSGGGLFDGQGRLVGITTFYLRGGQNLNFAIPTDSVRDLPSTRAWRRSHPEFFRKEEKAVVETEPKPQTPSRSEELIQELRERKEKVEAWPDDWMAHLLLGNALQKAGYTHQAVRELMKAVELKSDSAEAHRALGNALGQIGDWYGAVSELGTAAQIDPTDFLTCFNLAMALDKDDRPQDAVAQSVTCAHSRAFAPFALLLALSMSETGEDTGKAETVCQLAILADTEKPYGFECLGRVFLESNRYTNAIVAFKAALGLAPDDASLHHWLAQALDSMGEKEQASGEYQRAAELEPSSPTYKADYERSRSALKEGTLSKDKDGKRPN